MTSLRILRPVLACLILVGLMGLAYRMSAGGTPSADAGPLRFEFGLINLILLTYIAALTWLLAGYSSTNLRGQRRLGRFGALFAGVSVSLLALVLAGNLLTVAVMWTTSGVLLGCLVSHAGTVNAELAARRVQRVMALSSGLLWVAVLGAGASGLALDGSDPASALASPEATVVAVLMVLAGAVRSSLAPFHRWLPETAEAPSPVSALLHAGIVNGAGVIAVLQWDLLSAQPAVLLVLAVTGLVTVVWCSLEQRVRPDVKGRLAASTSAQMGWMALQVGMGAPAAAMLHLMSHGAWKAWLFLRAGGAVVRARRESSRGTLVWSRAGAMSILALTPTAALLTLAGQGGWDSVSASPVHLLLVGTAIVLGLSVGVEAAALERTGPTLRSVVASVGGLVIACYLLGAVLWDQQITARTDLSHPELSWGAAMATASVVAVALLAWGAVRLHPGSHHPVATLVSSTSLPPRTRILGRPHRPAASHPVRGLSTTSAGSHGTPSSAPDAALVRKTVEMAGKLMGPAWPLRATVAVNPLSGLEILPFDTALSLGERFNGATLRPSFTWFLDLYEEGQISDETLITAMDDHGVGGGTRGADGLVGLTRDIVALDQPTPPSTTAPATGFMPRRAAPDAAARTGAGAGAVVGAVVGARASRPLAHAHLWSARAWHRAEDRTADLHGPWRLWKRAAHHPTYRLVTGSRDAHTFADSLPEDPAQAIGNLLDRAGHSPEDLFDVVTALLAAGPGWVAHAQWRARRSGTADPLVELVALRLALTVLHGDPVPTPPATPSDPIEGPTNYLLLQKVWLQALDRSTQDLLCHPLAERQSQLSTRVSSTNPAANPVDGQAATPVSQSVWCIDVRSEPMRRHMESTGAHETFGFAGFFGITGRVNLLDGTSVDQCPVIVAPTIEIDAPHQPLGTVPAVTLAATRVAARPGLAFAVAEAAGAAAFAAALIANLAPRTWRRILDRSLRGRPGAGRIVLRDLAAPSRHLSVSERADAAEAMLRTIGLTTGFAPVLILSGHGSTTENNAYATAYDCGACGGNPGLLNAQAMADVLNDSAVRAELDHRGIRIPAATRVLAALHDTTTDQVTVQISSPADGDAAALLEPTLAAASRLTAAERRPTLPIEGRRFLPRIGADAECLEARASDWSEPMPEWGLAGCAAIIVGPRQLTRGIDLSGRTFLHSYNRDDDPDGDVLTAILNAPVIVSQWIASQYWFSSVAPTVLGAGDKTTHNVLGDIGVLSGAHGDLRTGLPWQALFARDPGAHPDQSNRPQHVPSRHLVIIDADPSLLAAALRQSPTVMTLLTHDWMRLVALDHGNVVDIATVLANETHTPIPTHTPKQQPGHQSGPQVGAQPSHDEVRSDER